MGGIFLFLLLSALFVQAQVGGSDKPLKFSVHTYTVNMGEAANAVTWNIYDSTATRDRIDGLIDLPYSKTTAYKVISQTQASGVASFKIEFSGNLVVGKKYRIAYREQGSDLCYIYKFFDFVLQSPFDVDVDPVTDRCPDTNLKYLEGTGTVATQTTVDYHVILRNSDYNTGGNYFFTVHITVTGQGGPNATIEHVVYPGYTWNQPPLGSTYNHNVVMPVATKDVLFQITYNDVPGVAQNINFSIDLIEGTYGERDIDVVNGTLGQNDKSHTINSIPAASYILAMD